MTDGAPLPAAEPPRGVPIGEWTLAVDLESAALARRLVSHALADEREPLRRKAALVTSELVGNGMRHARGSIDLQLHRLLDGWLLSVRDGSSVPPHVLTEAHLDERGRGLLIVTRMSEDVGWARTSTGKVVWAHLVDTGD